VITLVHDKSVEEESTHGMVLQRGTS